jgi:hypothetical protein
VSDGAEKESSGEEPRVSGKRDGGSVERTKLSAVLAPAKAPMTTATECTPPANAWKNQRLGFWT